jgi:hypothetical protein
MNGRKLPARKERRSWTGDRHEDAKSRSGVADPESRIDRLAVLARQVAAERPHHVDLGVRQARCVVLIRRATKTRGIEVARRRTTDDAVDETIDAVTRHRLRLRQCRQLRGRRRIQSSRIRPARDDAWHLERRRGRDDAVVLVAVERSRVEGFSAAGRAPGKVGVFRRPPIVRLDECLRHANRLHDRAVGEVLDQRRVVEESERARPSTSRSSSPAVCSPLVTPTPFKGWVNSPVPRWRHRCGSSTRSA